MKKKENRRKRIAMKLIRPMVIIIVLLEMVGLGLRFFEDFQLLSKRLDDKADTLMALAAQTFTNPMWNYNDVGIKEGFDALYADNEVERIALFDEHNQLLRNQSKGRYREINMLIYRNSVIAHDGDRIGSLSVVFSRHQLINETTRLLVLFLIEMLILTLLPVWVLTRRTREVLAPLQALSLGIDRIAAGNLKARIGHLSNDEIGDVATHIDSMAESLYEKNTQIIRMARHDSLTDLYNRTCLMEYNDHFQKNPHFHCAMCFIDLDNFKLINDNLGHYAGDLLLREVGRRLLTLKSDTLAVYRVGGDEFIVMLAQPDGVEAVERVAIKLMAQIATHYEMEGFSFDVTASIGISMAPEDGTNIGEMLKNADTAMYRAKESGRNTYLFFNSGMADAIREKHRILAHLKTAVERNEFVLHFQPEFSWVTGRVDCLEALIRWNSPELGFLSPLRFIPVAEESGLIVSIGNWVIEEAVRLIEQNPEMSRMNYRIAINLSAAQFQQKDFLSIFQRHAQHASQMELEITESLFLHSYRDVQVKLHALRRMGYSISLDDFGTGYSSLSYLKELPLDVVKIDKSFVDSVCTSSKQRGIIKAVVTLAHEMGLCVVAEGIETKEQFDVLAAIGCDRAQGYYISKPMSYAQLDPQYKPLS